MSQDRDPTGAHPFVITLAQPAQMGAIAEIANHEIRNGTAIWRTTLWKPSELERHFAARTQAGYPVHVALGGGEVLGYGAYGPFRSGEGYHQTVEHSLYVRAKARRLGVGRALLGALEEQARLQRRAVMIGGIDAANEGSITFHARHGFTEAARLLAVGRKFDRSLDLVLMTKRLS